MDSEHIGERKQNSKCRHCRIDKMVIEVRGAVEIAKPQPATAIVEQRPFTDIVQNKPFRLLVV